MSAFDRPRLGSQPDGIGRRSADRPPMDMDRTAEADDAGLVGGKWRSGYELGTDLQKSGHESDVTVPKSADLMKVFITPSNRDRDSHPVLNAGAALSAHHRAQWAAEDTCRDHVDDDRLVAKAKRTIDATNARRVELVDQIDAWAARIHSVADAALHTETLGQLIDRLAVAWVRSRNLTASAGSDPGRRMDARRALTQLAELCEAYDDLARDLLQGRRRLPNWRSLKSYGGVKR